MARIPIRMPKMSMTMTEGEVSEWLVKPGDRVDEGDVLCEVLTDKVDMEVESPAAGVITEIDVESGTVEVGTPIGWLEGEDVGGFGDLLAPEPAAETPDQPEVDRPETARPEAAGPEADTPGSTAPAAALSVDERPATARTTQDEQVRRSGIVPAVPRARALAREHGVDLGAVAGTGPDGLVTLADVTATVRAADTGAADRTTPNTSDASPSAAASVTSGPAGSVPSASAPAATGRPSKRAALVRARVAAKMTESAAVPQFTVWRDLVLDDADAARGGLSWTAVLLQAYAAALRQVPQLLKRWDGQGPAETGDPAVGLAVATPDGLLAPVIIEPDRTPPDDLDALIRDLVRTARAGKIAPAFLGAANATLSNLGGLEVDRFQALVTPPQATVLSVGRIQHRPVAVPGGVGTALCTTVGLTVDHRVGDGADGARLLSALAATLGASDAGAA